VAPACRTSLQSAGLPTSRAGVEDRIVPAARSVRRSHPMPSSHVAETRDRLKRSSPADRSSGSEDR
jgi:hypothetical protein